MDSTKQDKALEVFKAWDADGRGVIDYEELKRVLKKTAGHDDNEIKKLFAEFEGFGMTKRAGLKGKCSYEVFVRWLFARKNKTMQQIPSAWALLAQKIAECMQRPYQLVNVHCQTQLPLEAKTCHLCLLAQENDADFLDALSVQAREAEVTLSVMQNTKSRDGFLKRFPELFVTPKCTAKLSEKLYVEPAGDMAQMSHEQLFGTLDDSRNWQDGVFTEFFRDIVIRRERGVWNEHTAIWGVVFFSAPESHSDLEATLKKWESLSSLLENDKLCLESGEIICAQRAPNSRILFVARQADAVSAAAMDRFKTMNRLTNCF